MRVVLDTSVLVSAFRSNRGASHTLLRLADQGRFTMLATAPLFLEYEEILSPPEQCAVHGFSLAEVGALLRGLANRIEPIELYFRWRPQVTDPDDEMVVEAAVNGRANCIVTHNIRDLAGVHERLKVRVLKPSEFVKELQA